MNFTALETTRLRIREFQVSDRDFLAAFARNPDQLRYMMFSLASEREVDEFLSITLSGRDDPERHEWHLAVELTPGAAGNETADRPKPIGSVDLMAEGPGAVEAELGYFFLEEHWGNGYAAEAAEPLLDFAFGALGFHRVWGKCHVENAGSARVMEKLGMVREGTVREHAWLRDHWRTSYLYGILDREWKGASGTYTFAP